MSLEVQFANREIVRLDAHAKSLETVNGDQELAINVLEESLRVARAEIARLNSELARKQPIIASQLTKIEQLENTIQNKLVDISALEDTASDQTAVRRSVKFNAVHLLQSALAVLNGL